VTGECVCVCAYGYVLSLSLSLSPSLFCISPLNISYHYSHTHTLTHTLSLLRTYSVYSVSIHSGGISVLVSLLTLERVSLTAKRFAVQALANLCYLAGGMYLSVFVRRVTSLRVVAELRDLSFELEVHVSTHSHTHLHMHTCTRLYAHAYRF
jgi:hypothetical protein